MNIKDFLKYYIGQYWRVTNLASKEYVDGDYGTDFFNSGLLRELSLDNVKAKPILRRIESLVNHELLHIAKLAFFDKPMNYPDRDYRIVTEPGSTSHAIRIDNDWFEKELRIGHLSCNMWLSWKSAQTERIFNQPAIFHYLLSLGIDLFGLIEAGLAVDADTLNQQTEAK